MVLLVSLLLCLNRVLDILCFCCLQCVKNGCNQSSMSLLRKVKSLFSHKEEVALPAVDSDTLWSTMKVSSARRPMIWPIHPDVQKEIQKGTQFNMKVVVRGMRRVGKTAIVSRLCTGSSSVDYIPSTEISAGTIYFRSRLDSNEKRGAKVELWDVVDEGYREGTQGESSASTAVADARSIEVYRGCHLVAFVVDRTRKETMEYAVRESRHVPPTIPVVFILNFRDSPEDSHVVLEHDVDATCRELRRTSTPMILTASTGRPPPECCGVSATWVSISAITGEGMDLLRSTLEIPSALMRANLLEAQIFSYFQYIKQHQSWLMNGHARRHFLEQEGQKFLHPGSSCEAHQSIPHGLGKTAVGKAPLRINANGGVDSTNIVNTPGAVSTGVHRGTLEEDANCIASGFFDSADEPDTIADDGSGSDNNHRDSPKYAEYAFSPREKSLGDTFLDVPEGENLSSPNLSPLIARTEEEGLLTIEEQRFDLDIDEDNGIGDDFFATGASVDSSLHDDGNDSGDDGTLTTEPVHSNDDPSPLQNASCGGQCPADPVELESAAPLTSLQEDVSAILLRMQSALEGAAPDIDEQRQFSGNKKKHSRHERNRRKDRSSRERRKNNEGEFKMASVDDGSFEVIND